MPPDDHVPLVESVIVTAVPPAFPSSSLATYTLVPVKEVDVRPVLPAPVVEVESCINILTSTDVAPLRTCNLAMHTSVYTGIY